MQLGFLNMIKTHFWVTYPPVVTQDLTGKTIVVIGANSGIGYEAAKHFAQMNPGRLVLGCRSQTRGEEALENIKRDTGCKTVELRLLDLASFESVNAFADNFNEEFDRLDILLLNAATAPQPYNPMTKDGWETAAQTNHMAISLLALLLFPMMVATSSTHHTVPRLVVVSSGVHYWAKLKTELSDSPNPLRYFGSMEYFDPAHSSLSQWGERYEATKLLNVLFTRAFAARSASSKLSSSPIINTVNPGFCVSNLRRDVKGVIAVLNFLMEKALARTSEQGARQLVWAALGSENGDERALRGAYITELHVQEASDFVISEEGKKMEDKLWDDLIYELEKVNPKVKDIVSRYLA